MTNFQVYKKTLSFSLVEFLVDLLAFALFGGCCVAGFFIADRTESSAGLIGLVIGFLLGIVIAVLISIFISNRIKAAQIAMMTKGVTEGELPDHTYKAGMQEIKGRFGKITLFFVITNAIKGVFRQIGRTMTKVGQAVGGDVGGGIASAIDTGVQILIGYLCDCCLGWIFYRSEINSFRAGCEGAVIFFKHGKTLLRNVGRIFGMGFLSLIVIAGLLGTGAYLIFTQFPDLFVTLANEIKNAGSDIPAWLSNPDYLKIGVAALTGIILWSMIHSVLIRPFILVGVLRNFMAAGKKDIPTEAEFKELANKSPKFAKLAAKAK